VTRVVLITGAGGFLAGHAAQAFRAAGWTCAGIGRSDPHGQGGLYASFHLADLESGDRFAALVERYDPALVVHFAGPSSVAASMARPQADLRDHIGPIGNVLEGIRISGRRSRFLLVSSAAVYGNAPSLPIGEDTPTRPVSPYGFHKLMQELLTDEYTALFGVPSATARLFSTYGEGLRRLAVWDITRRAMSGDLSVEGTGQEIRDYLHAEVIAQALVTIAEKAAFRGEAINVASGHGTTIHDLAAGIGAALGIQEAPRFTGAVRRENPTAWIADVRRLQSLGFTLPEDPMALLRRTVEWIRRA
jgi:UDP-glucose 4-epimerase